jgi:hypothetical protein
MIHLDLSNKALVLLCGGLSPLHTSRSTVAFPESFGVDIGVLILFGHCAMFDLPFRVCMMPYHQGTAHVLVQVTKLKRKRWMYMHLLCHANYVS